MSGWVTSVCVGECSIEPLVFRWLLTMSCHLRWRLHSTAECCPPTHVFLANVSGLSSKQRSYRPRDRTPHGQRRGGDAWRPTTTTKTATDNKVRKSSRWCVCACVTGSLLQFATTNERTNERTNEHRTNKRAKERTGRQPAAGSRQLFVVSCRKQEKEHRPPASVSQSVSHSVTHSHTHSLPETLSVSCSQSATVLRFCFVGTLND